MTTAGQQIAAAANANSNKNVFGDIIVNVKAYGAEGDGATDDTLTIQAAINAARSSGAAVFFPPGTYITSSVLTAQDANNQKPIRLFGLSSRGSFFNMNNTVKIKRKDGTTHRMLYALGHGLQIENITLDGNGGIGDGIVVERGFELKFDGLRVVNTKGYGLSLRNLSNASINFCHVDTCGYDNGTTYSPAVLVGGGDFTGSNEKYSNTVFFNFLNIERSRATALNIGYGSGTYDGAEFVKFISLHVEQTIDNTDMSGYSTRPVVHIGNVRGVSLVDPFIYGGKGDMVKFEVLHNISGSLSSADIYGGFIMGHVSNGLIGTGAPDTLVHLVAGDAFGIYGTRTNTAVVQHILIDSGFGAAVDYFSSKQNFERGTTTGVVDNRATLNGLRTGINSQIVNNKFSHTNNNASFTVSTDGTPKMASANFKQADVLGTSGLALPIYDDGVTPSPINNLYIQSTTGKLVFKDAGGVNHDLY